MPKVQVDTDCEGPTCLNDNAYELCVSFLNNGDRFFRQLSSYDDILYLYKDVYSKDFNWVADYAAGDTLRLILPFLRAKNISNKTISLYVNKTKKVNLMKGAEKACEYLKKEGIPVYLISASYEPFAQAVAKKIYIEIENVFCTKINLDSYFFSEEEKKKVEGFRKEIVNMPIIKAPENIEGLDPGTRKSVDRLNQIFWSEMTDMDCWGLISETKVVNGARKVIAINESLKLTGYEITDVIYVGDSITDKEALKFVKDAGGLTISFNGNSYAVSEAEIACIGNNSFVIAEIAYMFSRRGKEGVIEFINNRGSEDYLKLTFPLKLYELHKKAYTKGTIEISLVTDENKDAVIKQSTWVRKEVRKAAGVLS